MPVFNDTVSVTPKFNYQIASSKLTPSFQPRLVNAAKMVPEPLYSLYKSYLNVGLGNPLSPLAELSITNLRSHENAYGIYLRHHSANGNVKLENGQKTDALYDDNDAIAYGKHIFKNSVLSGNIGYEGNKVNFYGYNPGLDTTLNKQSILQQFNLVKAEISVESKKTDSTKLFYLLSSGYDYFADKFKNTENHLNMSGKAGINSNGYYLGIDAVLDYYGLNKSGDSAFNTIFNVSPSLSRAKSNWKYLLGFTATSDITPSGTKRYLYPKANFEFQVAPAVLTTYLGVDGFLEPNNYYKIAMENLYILPGLKVSPTNNKAHFFGGIKGELSSSASYNLMAAYSIIDNQYFFINDTLSRLGNNFITVYDNIEQLNFMAEMALKASESLSLSSKINYYKYYTYQQEKPWHLPDFDMTLSATYNLRNKILMYIDLYAQGNRYAPKLDSNIPITLKPFADINMKLEYRYTKLFSVYLQFRNLTASQYMIWNQYPVYRFQVMLGLTYSL
jgi:hypothetical protein